MTEEEIRILQAKVQQLESENANLRSESNSLKQELENVGKTRTVLESALKKAQIAHQIENGFEFDQIGTFNSCYNERRGAPRQGGVVESALGYVRLDKDLNGEAILDGVEAFSHVWLVFVFHDNTNLHRQQKLEQEGAANKKATRFPGLISRVAPPRLTDKTKVGVFACRTPHRPNPIGLSLVEVVKVQRTVDGHWDLVVRGADLIHGTPVLDVKPYLPNLDALPNATAPEWVFRGAELAPLNVEYSPAAEEWRLQVEETVRAMHLEKAAGEKGVRKQRCLRIAENPSEAAYPYTAWGEVFACLEATLAQDIRQPRHRDGGEDFESVLRIQGVEARYSIAGGERTAVIRELSLLPIDTKLWTA